MSDVTTKLKFYTSTKKQKKLRCLFSMWASMWLKNSGFVLTVDLFFDLVIAYFGLWIMDAIGQAEQSAINILIIGGVS